MLTVFAITSRKAAQENISNEITTQPAAKTQPGPSASPTFEAWLQSYRRELERVCRVSTNGLQLDRQA